MNKLALEAAAAAAEKILEQLSSARENHIDLISEAVGENGPVRFTPSGNPSPDSPEYRTAIEDETFGVNYLSEDGRVRNGGYVTGVRVDGTTGAVFVDGVKEFLQDDPVLVPFSVPVDRIEDTESVLRFIAAYAR